MRDKNDIPWTTRDSDTFEYCMIVGLGFAVLVGLALIGLGALAGLVHV